MEGYYSDKTSIDAICPKALDLRNIPMPTTERAILTIILKVALIFFLLNLLQQLPQVKTIAPFNSNDTVTVDMKRNFSKLLIVKINEDFEVSSRLIDRKELARRGKKKVRIKWADLT